MKGDDNKGDDRDHTSNDDSCDNRHDVCDDNDSDYDSVDDNNDSCVTITN